MVLVSRITVTKVVFLEQNGGKSPSECCTLKPVFIAQRGSKNNHEHLLIIHIYVYLRATFQCLKTNLKQTNHNGTFNVI